MIKSLQNENHKWEFPYNPVKTGYRLKSLSMRNNHFLQESEICSLYSPNMRDTAFMKQETIKVWKKQQFEKMRYVNSLLNFF